MVVRSAEIRAWVGDPAREQDSFHNLHWRPRIELSLDCFVCERIGRTMWTEWGAEAGTCSSSRDSPNHPVPLRLSAFDVTHGTDRLAVSITADWWSAPFVDAKRGTPSRPPAAGTWTRLSLGYLCPDRAPGEAAGEWSVQTNLVMPATHRCRHCGVPVGTVTEAPGIRLLP